MKPFLYYSALHYAAGLSGPTDVLELLITYGAEIDAVNEEGCTPLFFATQSNNKFAACVLIEQGSNVRQKNTQGIIVFILERDEDYQGLLSNKKLFESQL